MQLVRIVFRDLSIMINVLGVHEACISLARHLVVGYLIDIV
jgi:hypothetical protein